MPLIPDTWEDKAEEFQVQSQLRAQSDLKTSLGKLSRPCLKLKAWGNFSENLLW